MDISIIIPAYNVEKYIERTLRVLIRQGINFGNYESELNGEIIVVNDGSIDSTLDKLNKFKETNRIEHFRIITQSNRGVSSARNIGLSIAKGKYIYFMDADDYILLNSLSKVLKYALENNCNVVRFDYEIIDEDSDRDYYSMAEIRQCKDLFLESIVDFDGYLDKVPAIGGSMLWHLLLKKEYIGQIRFDERLRLEEDYLFEYQVLAGGGGIHLLRGDKPYVYIKHLNSASYKLTPEKCRVYRRACELYQNMLENDDSRFSQKALNAISYRRTVCAMVFLFGQLRYEQSIRAIWSSYKDLSKKNIIPVCKKCQIPTKFNNNMFNFKRIILNSPMLFGTLSLMVFIKHIFSRH